MCKLLEHSPGGQVMHYHLPLAHPFPAPVDPSGTPYYTLDTQIMVVTNIDQATREVRVEPLYLPDDDEVSNTPS